MTRLDAMLAEQIGEGIDADVKAALERRLRGLMTESSDVWHPA